MRMPIQTALLFILYCCLLSSGAIGQSPLFRKHILDPRFVAEGVATGDVNRDGKIDVMSGPFWYEAPAWKKHRIHADTLNAIQGYSTTFLNYSLDVDNDGWIDLLRFDQPGATFTWYRNPGKSGKGLWRSFLVLPNAGIESPAFVDVDLDGRKDMICNDIISKQVVWLKAPTIKGDTSWRRHVISRDPGRATHQYTHGLGWGDINGDGLNDVIIRTGWWESPKDVKSEDWTFHPAALGDESANMFVIDADLDGDADVVSSSAHKYGVWWHEQNEGEWSTHEISRLFSQSHALAFKDINGDGHPDLISGKRYLAHMKGDPGTDDPSVLYWYEFVPGKEPQWKPHMVDNDSGVGNNFQVEDMNGDGKPDIIVSNKKGVYYFEQLRSK
ncbi:MAG: VCBS repeat-containing protein [Chitinophagaceae bacterium]|nr:MAG: VCBS repeat-containing protein [Chitinophagaceae bacterium]